MKQKTRVDKISESPPSRNPRIIPAMHLLHACPTTVSYRRGAVQSSLDQYHKSFQYPQDSSPPSLFPSPFP